MWLLLLLIASIAAGAPCSRVTAPPDAVVVDVCAAPWSTGTPLPTDPVLLNITILPAAGMLFADQATVNGVDVLASFVEAGGGLYTLEYQTAAGDEEWPWTGLALQLSLRDEGGPFATVEALVIPGAVWEEAATARGLSALEGSTRRAVCLADLNHDGHVDLFATSLAGVSTTILLNDGGGTFTDVSAAWGAPSTSSYGCGFGDADGDGWLDLFTAGNGDGPNELLMNKRDTLVAAGAPSGISATSSALSCTWGDVDGDGDIDLYVANIESEADALYINDGFGTFSEEGGARGVAGASENSRQPVMVDIDADNDLDIVLAHSFHRHFVFVNSGPGVFVEDGVKRGFSTTAHYIGLAVGDVNNDGAFDFFLSSLGIPDSIMLNGGSGFFVGISANVATYTTHTRGAVMFDTEMDGDLDIWVASVTADFLPVFAWLNVGAGTDEFSEAAAHVGVVPAGATQPYSLVAGDFDGDGDVDVFTTRDARLYLNPNARPGVPKALIVRPVTASGSQSAFGASVFATSVTTAWSGGRVVDGGSSWVCQSAYDVHIGVPHTNATYNVTVRWPGGLHPPVSVLAAPSPAVLVIRPVPLTFEAVVEWAHAARGVPAPGDSINVTLTPSAFAPGLNIVFAAVAGVDVTPTFTSDVGVYTLQYTLQAGDESFLYTGLHVNVSLSESAAFVYSFDGGATARVAFENATAAAGLSGWASPQGRGLCLLDVDNDGDVDVLAPEAGGGLTRMWINDGAGAFVDEAPARGVSGSASDHVVACAVADVDDNGAPDVFLGLTSLGTNQLFLNDGTGGFAEDAAGYGLATGNNTEASTFGDIDGDGDADLLIQNDNTPNLLFLNTGDGFVEDGAARGVATQGPSRAGLLVDVDNDLALDIVLAPKGAALAILINSGSGVFADETVSRAGSHTVQGAAAAGDVDGDGDPDLYCLQSSSAGVLLINDGTGFFTDEAAARLPAPSAFGNPATVLLWDADQDGDLDIAVGVEAGATLLLANSGVGVYSDVATPFAFHAGRAPVMAAGDVDGDGDLDVAAAFSGVLLRSHHAYGAGGNWLFVRPLSASGAQSAFGARVRVECVAGCPHPWAAVRTIGAASYRVANAYDAHFGLPDANLGAAYNVSVQFVGGVHPDASWETHAALGGVVPSALPAAARRLTVRPTPLRVEVGMLTPWDVAGSRRRRLALPVAGDAVTIVVHTVPPAPNLNVATAVVNGADVANTLNARPGGVYSLTYVTAPGDELWPWTGLTVDVALSDGVQAVGTSPVVVVAGAVLEEAATARGLAGLGDGGVCMVDVNDDDMLDVFVASSGGDQVWLNSGSGTFTDEAAARGVVTASNGCAAGDFDGDGTNDVVVVGSVTTVHVRAGSVFTQTALSVPPSAAATWTDAAGDLVPDVFVCVLSSTPNALFSVSFHAATAEDSAARGLTSSRPCAHAVSFDIDSDGDADILAANTGEADEVFVNVGGSFVEDGAARGFASTGAPSSMATGDVNGDGVTDVYLTSPSGMDMLFTNDGGGVFSEVGASWGVAIGLGSASAALFDFDLDGDLDVFVGVDGGPNQLLQNTNGSFVDVGVAFGMADGGAVSGVGVGDTDGDGDEDVVVTGGGLHYVSHSAQPGAGNWVAVRTFSAAGAGGALASTVVVHCTALSWSAGRVVDGGSGTASQGGPDVVFGLPPGCGACNVSVVWTGGHFREFNWTTHPSQLALVPPQTTVFVPVAEPPSPSSSATPSSSGTPSTSPSATPSPSPSATPSPTVSPSPSSPPSRSSSPSFSPSPSASASPSPTVTPCNLAFNTSVVQLFAENVAHHWTGNAAVTSECSDGDVLGGYGSLGGTASMSRVYALPAHVAVHVRLRLVLVDVGVWAPGDAVDVLVDGRVWAVVDLFLPAAGVDAHVCGLPLNVGGYPVNVGADRQVDVNFQVQHTGSLNLTLQAQMAQTPVFGSVGLASATLLTSQFGVCGVSVSSTPSPSPSPSPCAIAYSSAPLNDTLAAWGNTSSACGLPVVQGSHFTRHFAGLPPHVSVRVVLQVLLLASDALVVLSVDGGQVATMGTGLPSAMPVGGGCGVVVTVEATTPHATPELTIGLASTNASTFGVVSMGVFTSAGNCASPTPSATPSASPSGTALSLADGALVASSSGPLLSTKWQLILVAAGAIVLYLLTIGYCWWRRHRRTQPLGPVVHKAEPAVRTAPSGVEGHVAFGALPHVAADTSLPPPRKVYTLATVPVLHPRQLPPLHGAQPPQFAPSVSSLGNTATTQHILSDLEGSRGSAESTASSQRRRIILPDNWATMTVSKAPLRPQHWLEEEGKAPV